MIYNAEFKGFRIVVTKALVTIYRPSGVEVISWVPTTSESSLQRALSFVEMIAG